MFQIEREKQMTANKIRDLRLGINDIIETIVFMRTEDYTVLMYH